MKIEDLKDCPEWLMLAKTQNADVTMCDGIVVWRNGMWLDGMWHDGVWHGGVWFNGMWRNGMWHGGVWHGKGPKP